MQTCPTCSYESPDGAKFCRQCGGPLYAETEATGAATRNIGRQASAPAVSAPFQPSVIDAFGSDTSRYYQPPQPPAPAPAYMPPQHVPNTASLKPARGPWRWLLLFAVLLVGMGLGAAINNRATRRSRIAPFEYERLERLRNADRIRQKLSESIQGAAGRSIQEMQKHLQRIETAVRTAEGTRPRTGQLAVTTPGFQPIDLREYEYPHSTISHNIRLPGSELLKQTTQDSAETVGQFYQGKLGLPLAQAEEGEKTWLLFQSPGTPAVTVLIKEIDVRNQRRSRRPNPNEPAPGSLEIVVINAPFTIPRLTAPEAPPVAQPEVVPNQPEVKKPPVNPVPAQPKQSAAVPR
jgi:hypothetical protein